MEINKFHFREFSEICTSQTFIEQTAQHYMKSSDRGSIAVLWVLVSNPVRVKGGS
jgi:hypothetical protein